MDKRENGGGLHAIRLMTVVRPTATFFPLKGGADNVVQVYFSAEHTSYSYLRPLGKTLAWSDMK